MRLDGIDVGDIVQVERRGWVFYALVTGSDDESLRLEPLDRRVSYYHCRPREIRAHWSRSWPPAARLIQSPNGLLASAGNRGARSPQSARAGASSRS